MRMWKAKLAGRMHVDYSIASGLAPLAQSQAYSMQALSRPHSMQCHDADASVTARRAQVAAAAAAPLL